MSESRKRKAEDSMEIVAVKKAKTEEMAIIESQQERTSSLHAPIMLLTGHQAEVNSLKFSPDGLSLASGSSDKQIFLWDVKGECTNYMVLRGHKNVVLEVAWSSDGKQIFSASADKSGGAWDCEKGKRVRRFAEHSSYVSSICPARHGVQTCVTCSDDGTAKIWDLRERGSTLTLAHQYPITACCFDDKAELVFTGGIDNTIHCWDTRKPNTEVFRLVGHRDTITCLRLDPYGSYLLSNAMDNELRVWDIRPFAPLQRCIKTFMGAQNSFEKILLKSNWSPDGSMVGSGSADHMVYIWDTTSKDIKYKLPGHSGSVNEVDFNPKEPIIGSCGSDHKIYLGEITKYS
eukprot:TRINITY_DN3931_c0_g1_i1.p1 TRINITY_DN3931_c0_g1~~TRINITY_DN3931_c0_g1_i1.p1  ORF type:complete len:346 (+),score=66.91 TRINITY_DN3931_c0_g1_i1:28-1065(+)